MVAINHLSEMRAREKKQSEMQLSTFCVQMIFTMLGEAATTEIARDKDARGMAPNRKAAREGGNWTAHAVHS